MLRRMIATMMLVMSLAVVMVAPAAAQEADYDVRDISLISEGSQRSFYRVETYEQGLTLDQADALCQSVGLDETVGVDRVNYRRQGDVEAPPGKYDVVTCTGEQFNLCQLLILNLGEDLDNYTNFFSGTPGNDDFSNLRTDEVDVFCGFGGDDYIDVLADGDVFIQTNDGNIYVGGPPPGGGV